jgi:hypothetical protein
MLGWVTMMNPFRFLAASLPFTAFPQRSGVLLQPFQRASAKASAPFIGRAPSTWRAGCAPCKQLGNRGGDIAEAFRIDDRRGAGQVILTTAGMLSGSTSSIFS